MGNPLKMMNGQTLLLCFALIVLTVTLESGLAESNPRRTTKMIKKALGNAADRIMKYILDDILEVGKEHDRKQAADGIIQYILDITLHDILEVRKEHLTKPIIQISEAL